MSEPTSKTDAAKLGAELAEDLSAEARILREQIAALQAEVERLTEMVRGDCNYCQVEWDNEMCYTCTVAFPKGGTENHWQLKENSDG